MKTYTLHRKQFLHTDLQTAWDFFSSPKNLAVITPAKMNFKILSISGDEKIHEGQIIRYTLRIFPFIRVGWTTKISHVQYPDSFIDEQLTGPYKAWRHRHSFKAVEGGVEMTDDLEYVVPLGFLGVFANAVYVNNEVKKIFAYRYKVLEDYFLRKA